ncbi:MAG: sigma-E processing peptidase SpoIIGA [Oscillospiraceae bacterium]|jgi:stage II sporulation protein GA (sporulation sigma-E factor processing peptidase)|nr:sigma-E processing peptidase SpoIIGA [Oscillospiraceae bacterium]
MTVYLDILFLLNLFVNFFLIRAAALLCGRTGKRWRVFLGAAAGAAGSLLIFLPRVHMALSILLRLALSCLIIALSFGFGSKKAFLRLWGAFFAASFIFAGFMLALWFCLKPDRMAVNNGVVYFDISPLLLVASTLACYSVITFIRRLFRINAQKNDTFQLEISFKGQTVSMTALYDTGHTLVDILSGAPVVVADYRAVEPLIPALSRKAFTNVAVEPTEDIKERYRLIPYSVIGGAGLLPAFRPDSVRLFKKSGALSSATVCVAVSEKPLSPRFSAIFGSELFNNL